MHNYLVERKRRTQLSIQLIERKTIWGTSGVYSWTNYIYIFLIDFFLARKDITFVSYGRPRYS